ncbi:FAD-dependent oxidoreductase [Chloroflexota bacterium]
MKLFEPITIRSMTLKNRIVMPPMQVNLGFSSHRAQAYHAERARGGASTIIVAATSVDQLILDEVWSKTGRAARFCANAGLVADAVHKAGAKVGIQLWHGNRYPNGIGMYDTRGDDVAPSPREEMRELTPDEIRAIVHKFALAAAAARMAGYDFVEFHGAHGYMPCQFFSPAFNRRSDEYGGDLERRMRFGLECVQAMRRATGGDYPIFYRLGAWEDIPDGIKLDEAIEFAVALEKAGVDVLDVSVGQLSEPGFGATPGPDHSPGTFVHLAAAIKAKVKVPVIAVGRINFPVLAESILVEGKADLIAIGRQLIADPYWPEKMSSNRNEDIAPCLSCNFCLDSAFSMGELRCSVNPLFGKEAEYTLKPAEPRKKVLVVGGGPAGMEAAITLAGRGHQVSLWEKEDRLGGQLILAGVPPHKSEVAQLNRYLIRQMEKSGVSVSLGTEAAPESIEEVKPDAVVLATGSRPWLPQIPGIERTNVVHSLDVLTGNVQVGERVAIIGGELVGCETAEYLAERNRKVTVMRRGKSMAVNMNPLARDNLLSRLTRKGVALLPGVKYENITEEGVVITKKGKRRVIPADSVVVAVGAAPVVGLLDTLRARGLVVYPIGDCVSPGKIADALRDGLRIGQGI